MYRTETDDLPLFAAIPAREQKTLIHPPSRILLYPPDDLCDEPGDAIPT